MWITSAKTLYVNYTTCNPVLSVALTILLAGIGFYKVVCILLLCGLQILTNSTVLTYIAMSIVMHSTDYSLLFLLG